MIGIDRCELFKTSKFSMSFLEFLEDEDKHF